MEFFVEKERLNRAERERTRRGRASWFAVVLLASLLLPSAVRDTVRMKAVWESFHPTLKRLLASDIAIRMCEGMADIFVVLYVTNVSGTTIPRVRDTDRDSIDDSHSHLCAVGENRGSSWAETIRDCHVLLFCLLSNNCYSRAQLWRAEILAFIVGGLREIGEPSRKAMIVDFAEPVSGANRGLISSGAELVDYSGIGNW